MDKEKLITYSLIFIAIILSMVALIKVAQRSNQTKGDKGDRGQQGMAGPTGPTGPKGDVGPKGDIGPEGVQGPTGPQGVSSSLFIQGTFAGKPSIPVNDIPVNLPLTLSSSNLPNNNKPFQLTNTSIAITTAGAYKFDWSFSVSGNFNVFSGLALNLPTTIITGSDISNFIPVRDGITLISNSFIVNAPTNSNILIWISSDNPQTLTIQRGNFSVVKIA